MFRLIRLHRSCPNMTYNQRSIRFSTMLRLSSPFGAIVLSKIQGTVSQVATWTYLCFIDKRDLYFFLQICHELLDQYFTSSSKYVEDINSVRDLFPNSLNARVLSTQNRCAILKQSTEGFYVDTGIHSTVL